MITRTELSHLWSEIKPQSGKNVGRRADPSHPLDFFITYDEKPNMQLMLLSDFQPNLPNSSNQLFVRGNKRTDCKYAICFSLKDNDLKVQYVSLCWDIIDCTFKVENQKIGVKSAIKRFVLWQKLLAESREKKLSETAAKGLIGELYVLKNICIKQYGLSKAIAGWIGPLLSDRDFEYEDKWLESKFVSLSKDNVKISSLDQLDTEKEGYLILCRAEKTSLTDERGITLNSLIQSVLDMIENDENTSTLFRNRIILAGWSAEEEQAKQPYIIHRLECYCVKDNSFPRIRRSQIHSEIVNGEYALSIPALKPWMVELNQ